MGPKAEEQCHLEHWPPPGTWDKCSFTPPPRSKMISNPTDHVACTQQAHQVHLSMKQPSAKAGIRMPSADTWLHGWFAFSQLFFSINQQVETTGQALRLHVSPTRFRGTHFGVLHAITPTSLNSILNLSFLRAAKRAPRRESQTRLGAKLLGAALHNLGPSGATWDSFPYLCTVYKPVLISKVTMRTPPPSPRYWLGSYPLFISDRSQCVVFFFLNTEIQLIKKPNARLT